MKPRLLRTNIVGEWAVFFLAVLIIPDFSFAQEKNPSPAPPETTRSCPELGFASASSRKQPRLRENPLNSVPPRLTAKIRHHDRAFRVKGGRGSPKETAGSCPPLFHETLADPRSSGRTGRFFNPHWILVVG
jgi:hypothetical protein